MLSNRLVIVIAAALAIGAINGCNQSDKQPDKAPVVNGVWTPDVPAKEQGTVPEKSQQSK